MAYKQVITVKVGSTTYTLPKPSYEGFQVNYNKVWSKNTGRVANGNMKGTIIAIKRSLKVTYNTLSASDFEILNNALNTTTPFFTVTYYKPGTNTQVSGIFYASDVESPVRGVNLGNGTYMNVSFELIEQ